MTVTTPSAGEGVGPLALSAQLISMYRGTAIRERNFVIFIKSHTFMA